MAHEWEWDAPGEVTNNPAKAHPPWCWTRAVSFKKIKTVCDPETPLGWRESHPLLKDVAEVLKDSA